MSILMPLIMMVAVGGIGLWALNKWNPSATAAAAPTTAPTETATDTGDGDGDSGDCEEGKACRGATSGWQGKLTGEKNDDGKCICRKLKSGSSSGSGSGGGSKGPDVKTGGLTNAQILARGKFGVYKPQVGSAVKKGALGRYARAYHTTMRAPSIMDRMLVEIPNDNDDYLYTPRSYFTYESDQPEYYTRETTQTPMARSAYVTDYSTYDEPQNTMPFIHMYHTFRQAPLRLSF